MNVLFIVTESTSANGICALSVAKAMLKRGDEVSCIVNREYGDKIVYIKDGIQFITVSPRMVYAISSLISGKKDLSRLSRKYLGIISWIINKVELFFSLPTWPVISRSYARRIFNSIKELGADKKLDIIVPVYTQIDTVIAANRYKKQCDKSVIVIPYFLDSLAAGYGPKMMSKKWVEKRGLKWERKLLQDVDHIVMMKSSEHFYDKHQNDLPYYRKISFLDLPLFMPVPYEGTANIKEKKEILYVGTIPGHIRNPKYLLETFSRLERSNVTLTIIGPSTCETLIAEYVNKDSRITRIQSVPHEEAIKRIQDADILLNLGNNITTMTPSKIFEYISTGKPIISTAPIPEEPCIPYLKKYGNSIVLYENRAIDESVKMLETFIQSARTINPNGLSETFCLNHPNAFLEVVDKTFVRS